MTKTVVVIAKVKSGSESAFESLITTLFEKVGQEPGCQGVSWGPTETPGQYALIERYADEEAIQAHRASAHMKEHGPALGALFEGAPTLVKFIEQ